MENKKRMPATVLAQMEVFDYLKEKVGERKTRTEAYCDLLDKAMAGFVSSYLRRQDYELRPCQCHVTVSDLAVEWRWHRATVRSFLDTLESFGLLTRIRLPDSLLRRTMYSPYPALPRNCGRYCPIGWSAMRTPPRPARRADSSSVAR